MQGQLRNLLIAIIFPTIMFYYVKALDRDDYEFYAGKHARAPSYEITHLQPPNSSSVLSTEMTGQ